MFWGWKCYENLRAILAGHTYKRYARPSQQMKWRVQLPGQAKEGSRELVQQIRAELRRRSETNTNP